MTGPAEADAVETYWRPGCFACLSLLGGLARTGFPLRAIDVGSEAGAAARLRELTRGDETVPTVVVGEHVMVNPRLSRGKD